MLPDAILCDVCFCPSRHPVGHLGMFTNSGRRVGVHETRRNIVTEGVDVNSLLGREFQVGTVRMRGAEPTRPCHRPSALVQKTGFAEAFAIRGGVRAEVLSDGTIYVGDLLRTFAPAQKLT